MSLRASKFMEETYYPHIFGIDDAIIASTIAAAGSMGSAAISGGKGGGKAFMVPPRTEEGQNLLNLFMNTYRTYDPTKAMGEYQAQLEEIMKTPAVANVSFGGAKLPVYPYRRMGTLANTAANKFTSLWNPFQSMTQGLESSRYGTPLREQDYYPSFMEQMLYPTSLALGSYFGSKPSDGGNKSPSALATMMNAPTLSTPFGGTRPPWLTWSPY
jgi:hypothetical protein